MSPVRFFIAEFGCANRVGHRCNGVEALAGALKARNQPVRCGVNVKACDEILQSLDAEPIFNLTPWPPFSKDKIAGDIENFLAHGDIGARDFAKFLDNAGVDDVVILYTASENEIWALAKYLETCKPQMRARVVVNAFLPQFFDLSTEQINVRGQLLRTAIKKLRSLLPADRLVFLTLTERLAGLLGKVADIPFLVSPNPIDLTSFAYTTDGHDQNGPVRIAAPGSPKGSKGAEIVPELVSRTADLDIVFCIQNRTPSFPALPNVEFQPEGLSRKDYVKFINDCNLTILPYDQKFYTYGVSAIFEEAVSAGHGILTSTGTWMADFIDAGTVNGEHAPANDANLLEAALRRLVGRIDAIRQDAHTQSQNWRRAHGAAAYVDVLVTALKLG